MGPQVRGRPARESVETHRRATGTTADANQTIRQSARRLGRPVADIARIHLAIDDRRSLHTVARSHTTEWHFSINVCSRILVPLGFATWCAVYFDMHRDRQFVSELWRKTALLLGAATNTTTSYHPQANSLVERMHRMMKAALKSKLETDPNWVDALPVVMLGIRAAMEHDMKCSSAEMVFGEPLRLPGEFFVSADGD